jgi:PAS domain-containing protein
MFFKNKNEKILSEVINSNYAVIYFKPDGTIIKANEVFLKTMGYSLEEIVGKHHSIFCEEKFAKTQENKVFKSIMGEANSPEFRLNNLVKHMADDDSYVDDVLSKMNPNARQTVEVAGLRVWCFCHCLFYSVCTRYSLPCCTQKAR